MTLSGGTAVPLLTEVPYGVPLRTLAAEHGTPDAGGALMGGLFGGLVDAGGLDLPLEPGALAAAGTALGCGAIRFLPAGACPVTAAAEAVGHLAAESARQCGVCVTGTAAVHGALKALAAGTAGPETLVNLTRWSRTLPGRGACGLLDAASGTAGSLLRAFPEAVPSHLGAACPACAAWTTDPTGGGRGRLAASVPEVRDPFPYGPPTALPTLLPVLKGTP